MFMGVESSIETSVVGLKSDKGESVLFSLSSCVSCVYQKLYIVRVGPIREEWGKVEVIGQRV